MNVIFCVGSEMDYVSNIYLLVFFDCYKVFRNVFYIFDFGENVNFWF